MNGAFDVGAYDDVAFDVGAIPTLPPFGGGASHGQAKRFIILRDPDWEDEEIIAAWMAMEEQ